MALGQRRRHCRAGACPHRPPLIVRVTVLDRELVRTLGSKATQRLSALNLLVNAAHTRPVALPAGDSTPRGREPATTRTALALACQLRRWQGPGKTLQGSQLRPSAEEARWSCLCTSAPATGGQTWRERRFCRVADGSPETRRLVRALRSSLRHPKVSSPIVAPVRRARTRRHQLSAGRSPSVD